MQFRTRKPSLPLAPYVEILWTWECFEMPHRLERLLPDGSMQLVINLWEDETRTYEPGDLSKCHRLPGAVLGGAHSRFFVLDTAEQRAVVGIVFRPGGARAFFGLPVDEMRNQQVPLEFLWGGLARELRERLLGAATADERLNLMEGALLSRWKPEGALHPAVQFAVREFIGRPEFRTVADITAEIGLSSRRFIELFRSQVGLTPKVFSRIRRFRRTLARIQAGTGGSFTDLALSCGYFDQAHFIHDFRAFSGMRPTEYALAGARQLSHVPIES